MFEIELLSLKDNSKDGKDGKEGKDDGCLMDLNQEYSDQVEE
jgi:hypothetical protein